MNTIAVTTTRRPLPADERRAARYAAALRTPYFPRQGASFPTLQNRATELTGLPCPGLLVVAQRTVSIWTPQGMLAYHPGMALHRVAALRRGEPDAMVLAMQLRTGEALLDCTAGLAADAVVASHAVGPRGQVTALESVAALALMLKTGLRHYAGQGPTLTAAMRRVRIRHARHQDFLAACPAQSFDVVYFDPMFAQPVAASSGIAPLRPLADYSQVTAATLAMARRVARRLVVVKDRQDGPYTRHLHWDDIVGGRHSRICYCLLGAEGAGD